MNDLPPGVKDVTDWFPNFPAKSQERMLLCRHTERVTVEGVSQCVFCQYRWRRDSPPLPYVIRRKR